MTGLIKSAASALLRKVRGVLGLGVSGAVLGFLAGVPIGVALGSLGPWVGFLTFFGAATGVGFGAILGITDSYRSLDQLRTWQAALIGGGLGAFIAALFPVNGGQFIGTAAVLGATLTASMVTMAKRAQRLDLSPGEADREAALPSGGA
jgi:hypothetical protein